MSRTARATFIGSVILSGLTIWGVHFLQEWERDRMYQGVVRDEERRKQKQQQRQADFQASLRSRELFEKTQSVGGSNGNTPLGRASPQMGEETA
ncbi:hypothetical protein BU17DRAFT_47825 [Hysterangium stoloniferum]|nr:hypothetical protein BU17DRAFT_47825 [Hysterangium stoloniferum]